MKKILLVAIFFCLFISCDEAKWPTAPTTTSTSIYSNKILGLTYIEIYAFIWENWDSDIEDDGFRVAIDFCDNNDNDIDFSGIRCRARIKLFAYKKNSRGYKDETQRRQVYSKMHTFNNSDVSNIFSSPIKIWDYEIKVSKNSDYKYGECEVTVYTPEQGEFSDIDELCRLYPD